MSSLSEARRNARIAALAHSIAHTVACVYGATFAKSIGLSQSFAGFWAARRIKRGDDTYEMAHEIMASSGVPTTLLVGASETQGRGLRKSDDAANYSLGTGEGVPPVYGGGS